jgi:flagellar biosynthetic protein FliS
MNRTDLAYRRTAAEAASGLALLISLYDTLAGDLRRSAEAQRANDIEWRCREVRHAVLVIGYLEDWVNKGTGGPLAQELTAFYGSLRRKLIEAEVKQSAEIFEQQMSRVLEVRESWQNVEVRNEPSGPEVLRPPIPMPADYPAPRIERLGGSWSA